MKTERRAAVKRLWSRDRTGCECCHQWYEPRDVIRFDTDMSDHAGISLCRHCLQAGMIERPAEPRDQVHVWPVRVPDQTGGGQ